MENSSFIHEPYVRRVVETNNPRLDRYLTQEFPHYSRTYLSRLIGLGNVKINGMPANKPSMRLLHHDTVEIIFPSQSDSQTTTTQTTNYGIDIIFKHEHFLIINKPAGLIVHKPHAQSSEPTVVDWLKMHIPGINTIGVSDRPGIIHRLDKDTSGLMILALTNYAHMKFGEMFKQRTIKKTYRALVAGHPPASGILDTPIFRHPIHKHKMTTGTAINAGRQKMREAITHYKVLNYFDFYCLVEAKPVTGRTHQIRVHFDAIGHSLIGDAYYNRKKIPSITMQRHALHAYQLEFVFDGQPFSFTHEAPEDFLALLRSPQRSSVIV